MLKKSIASALILGYSFLMVVDGAPSTSVIHDNLKPILHSVLNALGQWQGNLRLFAPVPDRSNSHIEALMVLDDGTEARWRSPDWQNISNYRRFVDYRMMRFVDTVRLDSYAPTWLPFATYLKNEFEKEHGRRVKKIALSRHGNLIEEPKSAFYNEYKILPHSTSFVFYQKEFSR